MISAFIVTRDSGPWLAYVIANLRTVADEVLVIVDAASTDASYAVAQRCADRAEYWRIPDGLCDSVRNEAAALCAGDWLWMHDDDELVPPQLAQRLPHLLHMGYDEFAFPRQHLVNGGADWINAAPWWPDTQTRLRSREAWRAAPWPRLPHQTPPDYNRLVTQTPFWHLKYLLRPRQARAARLRAWGQTWAPALSDHYRRFSLAEDYQWPTQAVTETVPELAQILEAVA